MVRPRSRPALEPVLMLGVSILQDLAGVPERRAVERFRSQAGWNFALNRPLGDAGSDAWQVLEWLRQARDRGLAPVSLQNYFIGASGNGKRWRRRAEWKLGRAALPSHEPC